MHARQQWPVPGTVAIRYGYVREMTQVEDFLSHGDPFRGGDPSWRRRRSMCRVKVAACPRRELLELRCLDYHRTSSPKTAVPTDAGQFRAGVTFAFNRSRDEIIGSGRIIGPVGPEDAHSD